MSSVVDIHSKFLEALNESRSLFTYCLSPFGSHSNAGVESAFLDAFKAWEVFLDELIFAYLMGEFDIAGNTVQTIVTLPNDDRNVYVRVINGVRGSRSYINWADPDNDIKPRLELYFTPSLGGKIDGGLIELRDMLICRNAIAHSSRAAFRKLSDLWTRKQGTSNSPVHRSADVLLLIYSPNPPFTWFDRYLQVLETLSQNLIEVRATDQD